MVAKGPEVTGPKGEAMRFVEERTIAKWLISQKIGYYYKTGTYVGDLYHESIFLLDHSGLYIEYIPDMDREYRVVGLKAKRKSLWEHGIPYMFLGRKDLGRMGSSVRRHIEFAPKAGNTWKKEAYRKFLFWRALDRMLP